MASSFNAGDVTLAAATAVRLSTLLIAEGFLGNFIGAFLDINSKALTDVFQGSSASVDATTGRPIPVGTSMQRVASAPRWCVDPSRIWLFSTAGGSISVTFETF